MKNATAYYYVAVRFLKWKRIPVTLVGRENYVQLEFESNWTGTFSLYCDAYLQYDEGGQLLNIFYVTKWSLYNGKLNYTQLCRKLYFK